MHPHEWMHAFFIDNIDKQKGEKKNYWSPACIHKQVQAMGFFHKCIAEKNILLNAVTSAFSGGNR